MGIYNRDYARDSSASSNWGGGGQHAATFSRDGNPAWFVKAVLIANVAVFLANAATHSAFNSALQLQRSEAYQLVWRLLTYGFCHSDVGITHILFNMIGLWIFGGMLERVYDSRELLSFYLCSIIFAGCVHLMYQVATNSSNPTVGASGGIYSLVFLAAMRFPRSIILLMLVIPMQLRFLPVLWVAVDIIGMSSPDSRVAHMAHLGGGVFGLAYGYFQWNLTSFARSLMGGWTRKFNMRRRPQIRVYRPSDDTAPVNPALDHELDRILAKISSQGEASLTPRERASLEAASRRANERRRR
ncbi:MAG: rhomboid family intramembrane serine protease [Planctomycetota bacterium]|nr:rhomboid family intramembrane serine protease [Planctomycetota bacterium]